MDHVLKHLTFEKYFCTFQENDFQLLEVEVEGSIQCYSSVGAYFGIHAFQLVHQLLLLLLSWSNFQDGKIVVGYSVVESNYS